MRRPLHRGDHVVPTVPARGGALCGVAPRGGRARPRTASRSGYGSAANPHHHRGDTVSDDNQAAKELVETLKDGERGFASAAEKVRDSDHPEWAPLLQRLSEQRAGFHREIVALGHDY